MHSLKKVETFFGRKNGEFVILPEKNYKIQIYIQSTKLHRKFRKNTGDNYSSPENPKSFCLVDFAKNRDFRLRKQKLI